MTTFKVRCYVLTILECRFLLLLVLAAVLMFWVMFLASGRALGFLCLLDFLAFGRALGLLVRLALFGWIFLAFKRALRFLRLLAFLAFGRAGFLGFFTVML